MNPYNYCKNIPSNKVIGETVEAIFSQELTLLDEYLEHRGFLPISSTTVKLPSL